MELTCGRYADTPTGCFWLSAPQARDFGLADEVVTSDSEMRQAVERILRMVTSAAPGAAAAAKALVRHVATHPRDEALLAHTASELARVRRTAECAAGMKAVLARERAPWAEEALVMPV